MSKTRRIIQDVENKLQKDEKILRLLYYPPADLRTSTPEPLSKDNPNILDLPLGEYWDILDERILTSTKSDDLEEKALCRLYVYAGKRRPAIGNIRIVKQEIVVDVFCHMSYDKDMRLEWIADYLSSALFLKRISGGLGRLDYRTGYEFVAPTGYQAYRHVYEISGTK